MSKSLRPLFHPNGEKYHLALVEDAESILLAIRDFLVRDFRVSVFSDFPSASDYFSGENCDVDLLISDIALPGGSGFRLVEQIREKGCRTPVILITAYDINEYIETIKSLSIAHILTKHSNLSLQEIFVTAWKILSGDIFGIDKYFPKIKIYFPSELLGKTSPANGEVFSVTIRNTEERIFWTDRIGAYFKEVLKIPESVSKLVLDEMVTNGMLRAPRHADGTYKYQKWIPEKDMLIADDYIELDSEDYILLQYGFSGDWMILSVTDPHGTLEKEEILYRLRRHILPDKKTGLPEGLTDSHGRGIFLMRDQLTHLIYNVHKGKKTEVIGLFNTRHPIPYKNISVYEIHD